MGFVKMKWGIHPHTNKAATAEAATEQLPPPDTVTIPVKQHTGAPAEPVVQVGETVKKGQLIAKSDATVTSYIHASISGKVTKIGKAPHPLYGEGTAICIESDGLDEWEEGVLKERNWEMLTKEELLEAVKNAGIVGMGGAAFPAHVKLNPSPDKKIDTLIINAAECEPYLTADHRGMLEYPEKAITGTKIMAKVLGVSRVVIGIEDNKKDAARLLADAAAGTGFEIKMVKTRYPQGAAKMLIYAVTGREVRPGGSSRDIGVIVQNVSTAIAVCDAVADGKPSIERIVTLGGRAMKHPKNVSVRIGTSFSDVIRMGGGLQCAPEKIIMGGPMMGTSQFTTEVPVIKSTSGILAFDRRDVNMHSETACIHCGKCVEVCPMGLNPGMLSILAEKGMSEEALREQNIQSCIECGCCSYICPSKRKIVHYIKYTKTILKNQAAKGGK